jgi:YIF1
MCVWALDLGLDLSWVGRCRVQQKTRPLSSFLASFARATMSYYNQGGGGYYGAGGGGGDPQQQQQQQQHHQQQQQQQQQHLPDYGYGGYGQQQYGGAAAPHQQGGDPNAYHPQQQQQQQQQYNESLHANIWQNQQPQQQPYQQQQHQPQQQQQQPYGSYSTNSTPNIFAAPGAGPQAPFFNPNMAVQMAALAATGLASGGDSQNAILNMANAAGQTFWQNSTARMVPGLASTLQILRPYFAVDNRYVLQKMKRLAVPFVYKTWKRTVRDIVIF